MIRNQLQRGQDGFQPRPYRRNGDPNWTPESVDFRGLGSAVREAQRTARLERIAAYVGHRKAGKSKAEAAALVGVSLATARREYEQAFRGAGDAA